MKPNILIAVPCYRGQMPIETVSSLAAIFAAMTQAGWQWSFQTINRLGIADVRNIFATRALSGGFTHLLFFDDDMTVRPGAILRLFQAGLPIIGLICPARETPLRFASPGPSCSSSTNGPAEVPWVGMAITLIETTALKTLLDSKQITQRTLPPNSGGDKVVYGFFDERRSADGIIYEDMAFCLRWKTLCAGKVFALIDEDVGHVGQFVYRGRYCDSIAVT